MYNSLVPLCMRSFGKNRGPCTSCVPLRTSVTERVTSTSRSKYTLVSADPILHDAFEKKESIPQAWSARRPQAHPAAARAHAPSPSRLLLTSSPRTPKRDAPSHARDHALARRVRRAGPRPHQLPSYLLLTSSPAPPLIPVVCQGCPIRGALEAGAEGCLIWNVWGAPLHVVGDR